MECHFDNKVSLIKSVVHEAVNNENIEIKVQQITTEGANYMGELFLLDVEEEGKETLKLFAKLSNIPLDARKFIPVNGVYKNEVIVYTTVAEEFNKIQEKYNIPQEKRFQFPKYYGSNLNELEEVVLLEDLADKGYKMYDRFKSLDWEFARIAVEELAKFHAISFALKNEDPEKFEAFSKNVKNQFMENEENDPNQLLEIARSKAKVIDDEENRKRVLKFIDENEDFLQNTRSITQYSVIMHGDYRASNILVKYEGDKIESLIPIDYQTASFGSPVCDLIYLIFSGTDQQFRHKYYEKTIEHYHDSLRDFLQFFSLDINEVYPKSAFYFELKDRLNYGLEIGLVLLPTFLVQPEDKIEMGQLVSEDTITESFENMKSSEIFVERLNEIVKDFDRWGLLPKVTEQVLNGTADDEEECSDELEATGLSDE